MSSIKLQLFNHFYGDQGHQNHFLTQNHSIHVIGKGNCVFSLCGPIRTLENGFLFSFTLINIRVFQHKYIQIFANSRLSITLIVYVSYFEF